MKIRNNYTSIYKDLRKTFITDFLSAYNNSFSGKRAKFKKQVFITLFFFGCVYSLYSQFNSSSVNQTTALILTPTQLSSLATLYSSFSFVEIILNAIDYITSTQLSSVKQIGSMDFGSHEEAFSDIIKVLTLFACIGCAYKVFMHYLNTERHDNVKAFTGYVPYIGVLILFMFSNQIVNKLVSTNQSVNIGAIASIGTKVSNNLKTIASKDGQKLKSQIELLEKVKTDQSENGGLIDSSMASIEFELKKIYLESSFWASDIVKYGMFTFFGIVTTSSMAVPAFIISFMVKMILVIMIAGVKIVFLLGFIPGFENAWKTYMLNLVNVLLWIPIFNIVIGVVVSLIDGIMLTDTMEKGQIIWLCIVSVILAYQSLTITFQASNSIISGAGAGVAGVMGALAGMNAVGTIAKGAGVVAVAGATAVGGPKAGMMANKLRD